MTGDGAECCKCPENSYDSTVDPAAKTTAELMVRVLCCTGVTLLGAELSRSFLSATEPTKRRRFISPYFIHQLRFLLTPHRVAFWGPLRLGAFDGGMGQLAEPKLSLEDAMKRCDFEPVVPFLFPQGSQRVETTEN